MLLLLLLYYYIIYIFLRRCDVVIPIFRGGQSSLSLMYIVDLCFSISCPPGEHCVALDEFNTTCESDCPHSNCSTTTVVPDVDPCLVSNPCQNEGRCYVDLSGDIACRCPFQFRGRFCDSPVDMLSLIHI